MGSAVNGYARQEEPRLRQPGAKSQTLPAGPAIGAAAILGLQRSIGNRAVAAMMVQREARPIGFGNEQLEVAKYPFELKKARKAREAKNMMEFWQKSYGVTIDSGAGVGSVKEAYDDASATEKAKIATKPWTMKELKAVGGALHSYGPILGGMRKYSSRAGLTQELRTMSKVNSSMDEDDSGQTVVDPDTLGETFKEQQNVSIFQSLSSAELGPFVSRQARIKKTVAHELAHALIAPDRLGDFITTFSPYWVDRSTRRSGASRNASGLSPVPEAPISQYGGTNAEEDLCETAGYFFTDSSILQNGNSDENPAQTPGKPGNRAPKRKTWMEITVARWQREPSMIKKLFRKLQSA